MRKFKTRRRRIKVPKKLLWLIILILFLVIFIFFSMKEFSNSYSYVIKFLLNEQRIINEERSNVFSLWTKNLDLLIPNYYLQKENRTASYEITYKETKPVIYIYNTHDREDYNDEIKLLGLENDIYSISDILCEKLNNKGLESIKETKRVSYYLDQNNWEYKDSYKVSRSFLEEAVLQYDSLNYFLDIHRDSVSDVYTKVRINDKDYARILFVLGKENPNYNDNLKLINALNNYLNEHYAGLSRGVYEKEGSGVNGVYNQDFSANCILIELGGLDNNLREVVNSTEILVEALYDVIGDNIEKSF